MADRNLNFDPTVTNVTPQMPNDGLLSGATDLADHIATMSANSKALNAVAQSSLAYRQADEQYRQKAAGNPDDPQALADLQATRAQITSTMGAQVPAIASMEYQKHMIELGQNSDKMNTVWAMHQDVRNANYDMQGAQDTYIKKAAMDGRQFGANGADLGQLDSVLTFDDAKNAITKFATPVLGAPRVEDALKEFSSNYVKSFVSGLAENNPKAAAAMLQTPSITEHFTPQEIGNMADLIKKTEKQQALIQSIQTTKNDGSLVDIVNDPNNDYLGKRLQIEKGMAAGDISSKAGKSALAILHTQDDIDTVTDTPTMHDIINRTYDLNAKAGSKADDYLNGVQDIHQQILQAQADGRLTAKDAGKVTNQVNELTQKKLSDATNRAGGEFYQANKQFDALPPEYRGEATRTLFYAGYGQKWTPQQYSNQASQIIQQITNQRRQSALSTVKSVTDDDTFVKSLGFSNNDIQQTAKQYGISQKEVVMQLRAHAGAAARAKQNGVKRIVGGSDESASGDEQGGPVSITRTKDTESDDNAMDAELMQ